MIVAGVGAMEITVVEIIVGTIVAGLIVVGMIVGARLGKSRQVGDHGKS